jgi:hypothetical protein
MLNIFLIFTECEVTENGYMISANRIVHVKGLSAPEASMLLRKRVKTFMGNDLHVSWKSLPEVKSSGLLGKYAHS